MTPIAFVRRGQMVDVKALCRAGYSCVMVINQDDVRLVSSLTDDARAVLAKYLLAHESDIASGMNDFDELRIVFAELLGWDAKG